MNIYELELREIIPTVGIVIGMALFVMLALSSFLVDLEGPRRARVGERRSEGITGGGPACWTV
jgi:hypothetical protein